MIITNQPSDNFSHKELSCKCCGTLRTAEEFLDMLELTRELTGPLLGISGGRCLKHNSEIGGHEKSLHHIDNPFHLGVPTIALDVTLRRYDDSEKQRIYLVAQEKGLSCGLKENSIHLDGRTLIGFPQHTFLYGGYTPVWAEDML